MKKSIILLSGGLDSTVSFLQARKETEVVLALTIDYGQKAVERELDAAQELCRSFKVAHQTIELPWYRDALDISLVDEAISPVQIKDFSTETTSASAKQVWAYNRNGLFTNIAAVFAEKHAGSLIITGFNKEEAVTFADNSVQFCQALNHSFEYSTLNHPEVISYTQELTKDQIVALGITLGTPLELIWSCYLGGTLMCGLCESCQRFKKALAANNYLERMEDRFDDTMLIS